MASKQLYRCAQSCFFGVLSLSMGFVGTVTAQVCQPPQHLSDPAGTPGDRAGHAVSIDGEFLVLGAPSYDPDGVASQGAAYIYRSQPGAGWVLEQTIVASDGAALDRFGWSVAVDNGSRTVVVGAYTDDVAGNADQGSVYVFTRTDGVWNEVAKLTAIDGAANDRFGSAVAFDGERIVVGAYFADIDGRLNQGAAYTFVRSEGVWTQESKLIDPDGMATDLFGWAVDIDGTDIIVGAYGDTIGSNEDQGSALIFVLSGSSWTQQAKLTNAFTGAAGDWLGYAVAIEDGVALVGAPNVDVEGAVAQGSAYFFARSGGTWALFSISTLQDASGLEQFGSSVALQGDIALVGAPYASFGDVEVCGVVQVYRRSVFFFAPETLLIAPDAEAGSGYGLSVGLSKGIAVVGAPDDDIRSNINQGCAWVFSSDDGVWVAPEWKITSEDGGLFEFQGFGKAVAIDGNTLLVGAWDDRIGSNARQGSVYVFEKVGVRWVQVAQLVAMDGAADDRFGSAVDLSGDTAVIGTDSGAGAYVFVRGLSGWTQQAKLLGVGTVPSDGFGMDVAIDGDWIIVGAPMDDIAVFGNNGAAFVFQRSGSTWSQHARLIPSDWDQDEILFGYAVDISGSSVLVGAPGLDQEFDCDDCGAAYIFIRNLAGGLWSQQARFLGSQDDDRFGEAVGLSGDWAAVGAPNDDVPGPVSDRVDQGSVRVLSRTGTAWSTVTQLTASDGAASDLFGYSLSITDRALLVGAPAKTVAGVATQGKAYHFIYDAVNGWTERDALTATDGATGDVFGWSVAIDGFSAVAGALGDDPNGSAWTVDLQSGCFVVPPPPLPCPGDANGDNEVNGADLSVLLSQFGQPATPGTGADFNGDGLVNAADLSVLLATFGTDCLL